MVKLEAGETEGVTVEVKVTPWWVVGVTLPLRVLAAEVVGEVVRGTEAVLEREDFGESVVEGLVREERVNEGDPEGDRDTRGEGDPDPLRDLPEESLGEGDTVLDREVFEVVEALALPPVALAEPPFPLEHVDEGEPVEEGEPRMGGEEVTEGETPKVLDTGVVVGKAPLGVGEVEADREVVEVPEPPTMFACAPPPEDKEGEAVGELDREPPTPPPPPPPPAVCEVEGEREEEGVPLELPDSVPPPHTPPLLPLGVALLQGESVAKAGVGVAEGNELREAEREGGKEREDNAEGEGVKEEVKVAAGEVDGCNDSEGLLEGEVVGVIDMVGLGEALEEGLKVDMGEEVVVPPFTRVPDTVGEAG